MEHCLLTKKSNCKNCYKCIRNCPVKSLRMTDGQAHIIRSECILCGECYTVCPQNAKQIRNDLSAAKAFISGGHKVYASVAPSYAAIFGGKSFADVRKALLALGFADAEPTAIGATVVKREYEKIIENREKSIIISSCCHSVNLLIEKHFPNAVSYLANVITPMAAHAKLIRERFGSDSRVVFIGPCISKKAEAEAYPENADAVLTFDELEDWLSESGITVESSESDEKRGLADFFPTSGGILKTMKKDPEYTYLTIDGVQKCIDTLRNIETGGLKNCFIEMSACSGSCAEGPVMRKHTRNPLFDCAAILKNVSHEDYEIASPPKPALERAFEYTGNDVSMPGSAAINEILHKMGKSSPEKELNCGSCGYNTCREKAVAVLLGKADISMCLPYIKEKAESFSDNIIKNTPNGIMVLDEQLNIVQINRAAKGILNLPPEADVVAGPVVRVLDPVDCLNVLGSGRNIYDDRKYLAEYRKYVDETIIYDKEYHILMIMMKDVTAEEDMKNLRDTQCKAAVEITDKVVEKQMRIVQEIASLLGETTAETKIALTKLKETLSDE